MEFYLDSYRTRCWMQSN